MNRAIVLLSITLTALGCVSASTPSIAPTTVAAPCRVPDTTLSATLWMQTSAEYEALTRQTYNMASRMLDAALADPTWTAALEQGTTEGKPPAIILDLDETVIDTSFHQGKLIKSGQAFTDAGWDAAAMNDISTPIPGAKEFLDYARSKGVAVFFISNRRSHLEPALHRTLQKYALSQGGEDDIFTRGERPEWGSSDKSPRRAFVASRYRVLLLLGDDFNDFVAASGKSREERADLVTQHRDRLGKTWFVLPNPVYGSWERATLGDTSKLDDCAQLELRRRLVHTGR